MTQSDLFDAALAEERPDWRPAPPPELQGEQRIVLDGEFTGLRWWAGDRAVGWAYYLPASGRKGYLPYGHQGGGNLDEAVVKRWLHDLRGVHIVNINTKIDLHMARVSGTDLVEQDNTFGDVAHQAALLDDHRKRFNLQELAQDFLGEGKVDLGLRNKGELWKLHAGRVAEYAVRDTEAVHQLAEVFRPQLEAEDLMRVLQLEEDVIPMVVEMEKNGAYLDLELLDRWIRDTAGEVEEASYRIYRATGVMLKSFDTVGDIQRVFKALGIPIETFTDRGKPSFTDAVLQRIDHPVIHDIRLGGQLTDLRNKYLLKYRRDVLDNGWLRYNLHQLRYARDDQSGGTVSGRFSSSGDEWGGINIQQVPSVDKQTERALTGDYVIRRLFVPRGDYSWVAADAMQIEYRLFAHYANSPKILEVYAQDPYADYHKVVQNLLQTLRPNIGRKETKNTNFAKIYGAGLIKFCAMLNFITENDVQNLQARQRAGDRYWWQDPRLEEGRALNAEYDRMFPQVKPLLDQAAQRAQDIGFVRTLLGRRARLKNRFHSSLNRIIQGGAADVNKRVGVELYRNRKLLDIVMRMTVHDEYDFDADPSKKKLIEECMNTQYYALKVPILWDVGFGANWKEAK